MKDRGREISQFIFELIRAERIPPICRNASGRRVSGGLVLLGWSLGNAFGFAALAHRESLPPEVRLALKEYLHTYVAFGAFITARAGTLFLPQDADDALEKMPRIPF